MAPICALSVSLGKEPSKAEAICTQPLRILCWSLCVHLSVMRLSRREKQGYRHKRLQLRKKPQFDEAGKSPEILQLYLFNFIYLFI